MLPALRYIALVVCLFTTITVQAQDLSDIGKGRPFSYTGNISNRFVFYNASGIQDRRDPFGYVLNGGINLSFYKLTLPFTFTFSNQGTSFGQPFNQFGVSPTYKWITLHLGYRNVTHSSLTLAGHQMLGAGVDLNPGKLRAGFMYGRLRRAVQFTPPPDSLSLDTLLQTQEIPILEDPVYQRAGWSAKVGYGDNNGFVDVILFKASDDAGSITNDSLKQNFRPAANAVIGVNARKTFFNKLSLYFEGAISAMTRDTELLNDETSDSITQRKLFQPFLPMNHSTYYYRAVKAGVSYSHTLFNLMADYQRIDADYQSMGAYFFNNDIESINLTPSFYLLKNKVIVTSGVSYQHDNLNQKKQFTTHRTIPRLNVSINPSFRYGIDLGYQDMMTKQTSGVLELTDSIRMAMNNPGFTVGGRYNIMDSLRNHTFLLMLNQFKLKDKNPITQPFSEYTATIVNFNYNFFLVKSSFGTTASITANTLDTFSGKVKSTGVSLGVNKGFKDNKVTMNMSWSANFSDEGNSHNATVGIGFTPGKKFTLSTQLNYLKGEQLTAKFNELTGFIECRYSFGKTKQL